jgi:hypothetical protein
MRPAIAVTVILLILGANLPVRDGHLRGLLVGTIAIGIQRQGVVVLAADRRWHRGRAQFGSHDKYAIHSTLPLAVVHGGIGEFPNPRRSSNDLVKTVLSNIAPTTALSGAEFRERFSAVFHSAVLQVRADNRAFHAGKLSPERMNELLKTAMVTIFVGYVLNGSARLAVIAIGDHVDLYDNAAGALTSPNSLTAFFSTGRYSNEEGLYGPQVQDRHGLVGRARGVVDAGIAEEARLNGGRNIEVGDGIDVIVVEATGARRVT